MDPILSDPRLRIGQYLHDVDAIVAQGGTVSESFTQIRAGWTAANSNPTQQDLEARVFEAISSGDAALVEAAVLAATVAKLDRSQIRERAARAVLLALRTGYAATAGANYATVAKGYDEAADRLTACASAVNIETPAEAMVSLSTKEREAWVAAAVTAAGLDTLLAAFVNAANLGGVQTADRSGATLNGALIALCCDPGAAHRRRVYEAWASSGRCGRWAALIALGCKLKAASLDGFAPYAECRPLEIRQVRAGAGIRQVPFDPEDRDYRPASVTDDPAAAREAEHAERLAKAWSKTIGDERAKVAETEAPTADATT